MSRLISQCRSVCDQTDSQQQDGKVGGWGFPQRDEAIVEACTGDDGQVTVKNLEIAGADIVHKLTRCTNNTMDLEINLTSGFSVSHILPLDT